MISNYVDHSFNLQSSLIVFRCHIIPRSNNYCQSWSFCSKPFDYQQSRMVDIKSSSRSGGRLRRRPQSWSRDSFRWGKSNSHIFFTRIQCVSIYNNCGRWPYEGGDSHKNFKFITI